MCVRCGTGRVAWCNHPTRHDETEVSPVTIRWDEGYQNWPGRLAWLEARVNDGSITTEERGERARLLAARHAWRAERGRS